MRAPCRVCRRSCALTRRGLVWAHLARPIRLRCNGSGLPPLGVPCDRVEGGPHPGQLIERDPLTREHPGGTVYLLCLDRPFSHARHYLGYAGPGNLDARLAHHAAGSGANLLRHVAQAGIGWQLVRTWPGSRTRERQLKQHGHTRRCPRCSPNVGEYLLRHLAA